MSDNLPAVAAVSEPEAVYIDVRDLEEIMSDDKTTDYTFDERGLKIFVDQLLRNRDNNIPLYAVDDEGLVNLVVVRYFVYDHFFSDYGSDADLEKAKEDMYRTVYIVDAEEIKIIKITVTDVDYSYNYDEGGNLYVMGVKFKVAVVGDDKVV